jgi:hypothetical protein
MPTFAAFFSLGKTQGELDFVNLRLETDTWLCVDPFAVSQRLDPLSVSCHRTLLAFFQRVVDSIRAVNDSEAMALLGHLREPNETRLGLSSRKPQGAGVGNQQARQLLEALRRSSAVKSGFLSSLEECELMIDGFGRDKISDLTTNIIRGHLIKYTQNQCSLHNVPMESVATGPAFDVVSMSWISDYADLPVWKGEQILLIPKVFVRHDPAYNHQKYYRHFVLDFLQAEELRAGASLVRTLQNKKRVVYKKDVEAKHPCSKQFLYEFSKAHPKILRKYRTHLEEMEVKGLDSVVEEEDESIIAAALGEALNAISPGSDTASEYHRLMVGAVEFIFFPNLFNPVKEKEIHEGRKRIDIVMENSAKDGVFHRLHDIRKIPCSFIPMECKNYTTDIANPELDQLSSRFSVNRGQVGVLCCRHFEDRELFVKRCQDTLRDGRGVVIPLDDLTLLRLLDLIGHGERRELDKELTGLINEVWT